MLFYSFSFMFPSFFSVSATCNAASAYLKETKKMTPLYPLATAKALSDLFI